MALDDSAWTLRHAIYAGLAATGAVPSRSELAPIAGGTDQLDAQLRVLHDHHQLVLDTDLSVRMALPFSGIPTDHIVL